MLNHHTTQEIAHTVWAVAQLDVVGGADWNLR
jgi:hypothetical protein